MYPSFFPQSCNFGHAAWTSEPQCYAYPHIPSYNNCYPHLWHNHNHLKSCNSSTAINIHIPPCPEPKPEPEPKKPIDFNKLAITVNPVTGEILDYKTKESTNKKFEECKKIIEKTNNNLEITSDNKIAGGCDNNDECKACVDALNSSISDSRKEVALFLSDEEVRTLQHSLEII